MNRIELYAHIEHIQVKLSLHCPFLTPMVEWYNGPHHWTLQFGWLGLYFWTQGWKGGV